MELKTQDAPDLSRREFVKGSVAGAAALASGIGTSSDAGAAATVTPPYAELSSLPPGAVKPAGWLRLHMEGQARLASALPEISYPFFAGKFWEGEENSPAWFTWEQKAYWVDGAIRLALVLDDRALLAKARAPLDYTLTHPSSTGFLGPKFLEVAQDFGGLNRWPNTVFNRALMALADSRPEGDKDLPAKIAGALRNHYLRDGASYSSVGRNITNLEVILWCYGRTGDQKLLALAEGSWRSFLASAEKEYRSADRQGTIGTPTPPRLSLYSDLSPSAVFAGTPVRSHGVSYAEIAKLPAILYLHTGNEEYRRFAVAAQRRIFDHHMLIDGIPSSSEEYAGTTALDEHETCDITDHSWAWIHLLQATGDGVWGDHIERACFNAHPGATRADWKGIQYFSSPNQFLANLNGDHGTGRWFGSRRLAYQPNPAQFIGCCGGNKHRFVPNYVLGMWMSTKDHGLAATLYGPSEVTAVVGSANQSVRIVQKTNYPFEETIRLEIFVDRPVQFPLWLRVPRWCATPDIKVNGFSAAPVSSSHGFAVLNQIFRSGDVITLSLPMNVKVSHWPNNGVGIERGPLVYALPIEATWSSFAEVAYSSDRFPTWEANPVGAWNYGVVVEANKSLAKVEVRKRAVERNVETSSWPWNDAPIVLTVPARRLPEWDYQINPKEPHQRLTPRLPEPGSLKAAHPIERLTLVPYGATQLRMAIFPKLPSDSRTPGESP